jgi:HEAT repeat protein
MRSLQNPSLAKLGLANLCAIAISTCLAGPLWAEPSEQELLAVLKSSAASPAEKALACKQLAIYGSEDSVPELAKLLSDPQLSSWSRIALEAIPGNAPDAALRDAAGKLQGRLLIGVLNSLGVRRNAEAVELLAGMRGASDREVAAAAIAALGEIGTGDAAQALRTGLMEAVDPATRAGLAEAAVVCAERRLAAGDQATSLDLYEVVRKADVPTQRRLEATRGVILAQGDAGLPLLAECLRSEDQPWFRLGLTVARELPAAGTGRVLTEALVGADPERGALLVQALADRPGPADLPTLTAVAKSGGQPARLAALAALGRLGDTTSLEPLLAIAADQDPQIAAAAAQALAELPGEDINRRIGQMLASASDAQRRLLVELVGRRHIPATSDLLKVLKSNDPSLRRAALYALGETVKLDELELLIARVAESSSDAEELSAAQQALKAAAIRMPEQDACAEQLANAIERVPEPIQVFLLETLSEVGGAKALQAIMKSAMGPTPTRQDAGSRLLGKWSNLADADALLNYARTGPTNQFRVRALRGYIALARRFDMPEAERVKMCRAAWDLSKQPADQKLVLDVLKLHPSPESFQFASDLAGTGDASREALETVVAIAQQVGGQGIDLSQLKKIFGGSTFKLEILDARYGAGETWQDVTSVLQKASGDLPWIDLPSPNYNSSFGGDPAPGVPKQLRVRYRLDGKQGEVALNENAAILLPIPKQ